MKKISFFASRGMGAKPFVILALVLLFLIPLQLVKSLVEDREQYRDEAVRSVLEPLGGKPVIEGFGVLVPCETVQELEEPGGKIRRQTVRRWMTLFPESWECTAEIVPYTLTRGIFEVPVFSCTVRSSGSFASALPASAKMEASSILWDEALFCAGISNRKNLTVLPEVSADGIPLYPADESPEIPAFTAALFYRLSASCAKNGFSFSVKQELQGGESISVRPVAAANNFSLSSPWPSPSFHGGWLPVSRSVSDKGFSAEWKIPGFSTNFPKALYGAEDVPAVRQNERFAKTSQSFPQEAVTVSFVTPVDSYQKTMRSVKYSILFLMIPFIALLVLEIFTAVRIHPVQYALIGLADVIFYLLLLAVSEHLPFSATYWLSAAVVCFLTLFYAAAIFRRAAWGAVFSAVQLVLYVFLFGTLQTEDYALLIGTLGLLAVTALLMVLTRKVDWYGSTAAGNSSAPK